MSTSASMIILTQIEMCSESRDVFKLRKIGDNISKTVQDRDTVAMGD